jgi:hypothetical protein
MGAVVDMQSNLGHPVCLLSQVGGVLLMAPEHRNSLYLKYLELAVAGGSDADAGLASQLRSLLNCYPYHDILDESDEALHHQ